MGASEINALSPKDPPPPPSAPQDQIHRLMNIIEKLRSENGCPWDRKQTPASMSIYLVEEVHELVDAIGLGCPQPVCEEIGDVLFHILFLTRLFQEAGHFDIQDVARMISEKMVRRHPHVFGDGSVDDVEDVRKLWKEIKRKEKSGSKQDSILHAVPGGLPALMKAYRVSERAAGVGFDWKDIQGVMRKAEEEWAEFNQALESKKQAEISMELGDLLFTLVNVARMARIHPETALAESTQKFEKRFRFMEQQLSAQSKDIESVPREELEALWLKAKDHY